jgi:hypothetical protein
MKTKQEIRSTIVRNKYTAQFKEQALERADKDGIPQGGAGFRTGGGDLLGLAGKTSANKANPLKTKSSNKLNWLALKETTPAWKRKWPF